MAAMDKKTRSALSKFGAYVRTRAKSSIRSRTGVSDPGSPPSSHVGTLKKLIYFGYDDRTRSVVIGPALFANKRGDSGAQVLEEGGRVDARDRDGKTTVMIYRPRPFMAPAFAKELPNAAAGFASQ